MPVLIARERKVSLRKYTIRCMLATDDNRMLRCWLQLYFFVVRWIISWGWHYYFQLESKKNI